MKKINKNFKLFLIFMGISLGLYFANEMTQKNKIDNQITYNEFVQRIENGEVKKVSLIENTLGAKEVTVTPNDIDGKEQKEYKIFLPQDDKLIPQLIDKNVEIITLEPPKKSLLLSIFISWTPLIVILLIMIFFMRKSSGGKGIFNLGKSKAQLINPNDIKVTFNDVVGCDEAKFETKEFVDFLKNPEKFAKLGGKIPRGVLFTGPSGTGKTLLAKALAKESNVPFLTLSGSDFIEMFAGLGAARVRDLFETAKKQAPCLIFIDEIDAIGAARSNGGMGSGAQDEREQTLNQLLVELDGFDTNKGVILVGATNRPEVLDPALLRPGRIDRQVVVSLPDIYGREEILKTHSYNVPLAQDVNLYNIARGTPGFSGAELANLINEAAIFAARTNSSFVTQEHLEKAKDKIMMGVERPSLAMSIEDKKDTAYHESGHAIVAKLLENADPVHKVTIIPRGRALGLTMQLPEQDKHSHKINYLKDKITILMGGRAAEQLFCNTLTTGASNDIMVATNIAKSMITEWGMNNFGPIALAKRENGFLGNGELSYSGLSQKTMEKIEEEIHQLLNEEYQRAYKLLEENKDIVEAMTAALMESETIDDWQIENLMNKRAYNDQQGYKDFMEKAEKRAQELEGKRQAFSQYKESKQKSHEESEQKENNA